MIVRFILSKVELPVPSKDTALKVCFNLATKVIEFTEQRNNFGAHCVDDTDAKKFFDDKSIETLFNIPECALGLTDPDGFIYQKKLRLGHSVKSKLSIVD